MEDLKNKKIGAWLGGNGQRTLENLDKEKELKLNKNITMVLL